MRRTTFNVLRVTLCIRKTNRALNSDQTILWYPVRSYNVSALRRPLLLPVKSRGHCSTLQLVFRYVFKCFQRMPLTGVQSISQDSTYTVKLLRVRNAKSLEGIDRSVGELTGFMRMRKFEPCSQTRAQTFPEHLYLMLVFVSFKVPSQEVQDARFFKILY